MLLHPADAALHSIYDYTKLKDSIVVLLRYVESGSIGVESLSAYCRHVAQKEYHGEAVGMETHATTKMIDHIMPELVKSGFAKKSEDGESWIYAGDWPKPSRTEMQNAADNRDSTVWLMFRDFLVAQGKHTKAQIISMPFSELQRLAIGA